MAITCHYFSHRFAVDIILVITLPGFPILLFSEIFLEISVLL